MTACTYLKRLSSTDCEKMFASRTQTNRFEEYRSRRRVIHQRCHSLSNSLIPIFNSICRQSSTSTIIENTEDKPIISPVAVKPLKTSQSLSYIPITRKYSNESSSGNPITTPTTTTTTNSSSSVNMNYSSSPSFGSSEKYPLKIKPTPVKPISSEKQYDPAMAELLEIFTQRMTQDNNYVNNEWNQKIPNQI